MFRSGRMPIDVALIMVSPPDEHGFCSLGVSVDMTRAAALSAKLLIAQVNRHMPRTLGNSFIHVREIDYLVEHDEPLLEWPVIDDPDEIDAQDRRATWPAWSPTATRCSWASAGCPTPCCCR